MRKTWMQMPSAMAEAYATEQMAMAQGNSKNPQVKVNNDKAMGQVAPYAEQQTVRNQLSTFETEIANRYKNLIQTSGKEKMAADLQKT